MYPNENLTPTEAYHTMVQDVFRYGTWEKNRTGVDTLTLAGHVFDWDMAKGFPAITTKKLYFRSVAVELEGFIGGVTDKRWYQARKCTIWDEWCRPDMLDSDLDANERKARQKLVPDLGPIYGWQWRHVGAEYVDCNTNYEGKGVDQLANAIKTLKTDPRSRRILVQAWNPVDLPMMALPACHTGFQLTVTDGRLNLMWTQRSCDLMLGIPFNIASYGLLLHLIAWDVGMPVGRLIGQLADVHIYRNHVDNAQLQLERDPLRHACPTIVTIGDMQNRSIFDWDHTRSLLGNYEHDAPIAFEVAV